MKHDALAMYKWLFSPSEGGFITLLYNFEWRLDLLYDVRVNPYPIWVFNDFRDGNGSINHTAKQTYLKDDEVYGFLKAIFPELNTREMIVDEVKKLILKMVKEIE